MQSASTLLYRTLGPALPQGYAEGAVLLGLGTLIWVHSRPYFTETGAAASLILGWYCLYKWMDQSKSIWMLASGFFAGFAVLIRMDSAMLYPGMALILLGPVLRTYKDRPSDIHPFILFCIPALMCGSILLLLNNLHFGHPLHTAYKDQPEGVKFSTTVIAGLYGFLFSAGKGLFFFSYFIVLLSPCPGNTTVSSSRTNNFSFIEFINVS